MAEDKVLEQQLSNKLQSLKIHETEQNEKESHKVLLILNILETIAINERLASKLTEIKIDDLKKRKILECIKEGKLPLMKCLDSFVEKKVLEVLLKKDSKELQELCNIDDDDLPYLFFAQVFHLLVFHFNSNRTRFLKPKEAKEELKFEGIHFQFRFEFDEHTQEFENLLLKSQLDVKTLLNSLKDLIDLSEHKVVDSFRKVDVDTSSSLLTEEQMNRLKESVKLCKNLEEVKKNFIQFCKEVSQLEKPEEVAETLCQKLQDLCLGLSINLGQVLQIISSTLLKQRVFNHCKEKSNTIKLILTKVPQILELPHILLNHCGYIQYSENERAKKFEDIPEFGPLFDSCFKRLKEKHPQSTTDNSHPNNKNVANTSHSITSPTLRTSSSLFDKEIEIPFSELKLEKPPIGQGASGNVYKATYKEKIVAVKKFKLPYGLSQEEVQKIFMNFRKEIEILRSLNHPNIVKCIGACMEHPKLCIVTEYCNEGSLFDLLHEQKVKLSTQQQLEIALKIAEGMEYLHTRDPMIVHRDLKSNNILMNDEIPKIGDFGVSQTKGTLTRSLHTFAGTYKWMAPEMMRNQSYNEKVDVWSFGMILYELTTNTIPYQHCQIEFLVYDEVIKYNKTPPIPKGIEIVSILHDLMKGCWNWDPQQRPSFSQIVQTLRNALRPPNITHTTATLSQFRSRVAVTSSGELVFFAGGRLSQKPTIGGGPSDRVDIYNVTSGSWTTATLSIPRHDLAATSSQNLVFFGGGEDYRSIIYHDRVDIYNTLNGSWSTATLSQPRVGLAATSVGNLVLFGGGYNSTGPFNVVDVFDVTSNTWTTATLSQARAFFAATSVDNRYALFGGGFTGSKQYSNVVDIFDSLSGMWNTTTLSQARCDLAATSLGNLAFFGGGKTIKGKEIQPSNVVDIFNSTSQTWSNATLSQARYHLAVSSIGEIVAFGGGTHDGSTPSSVVDMLNLRSNTWFTRNLSQPRYLLGSTSSTNKIFFGGGSRGNIESGLSNVVDIFEISAS